jgi:predicted PurR-regulated permease PerM
MPCNPGKPLRNGKEVPEHSGCYPGCRSGAKYGYYWSRRFWTSKDARDRQTRIEAPVNDLGSTMIPDVKEGASGLSYSAIDLAVRFGFVALLAYWVFHVVAPFLSILLWSVILAVALYPPFERLSAWLGTYSAATLVSFLCLLIVVGPITWLGLGMIGGARSLVAGLESGTLLFSTPPQFVKNWPVIGERIHHLWSMAATNMAAALTEMAPMLKPAGAKLLGIAQSAMLGLLELLVAIVIAGFLFARGPQLVEILSSFLDRALSHRGRALVQLAGVTIRNVARGVLGIAFLQALLAGLGFVVAGIPAASMLSFIALLLGIAQIGPSILLIPIVLWSWTAMETAEALMFTAYMIPVSLIDNVLRPILMARGLATPMPVIMMGVIGGTIAYGIVGLFFGPIVLSVAWTVMAAWLHGDDAMSVEARPPPSS